MFEDRFFGANAISIEQYRNTIATTIEIMFKSLPEGPYSGASPAGLSALNAHALDSIRGIGLPRTLAHLGAIVHNSIALWHPQTVAHLHCRVLIPALAAEVVIAALNQSMDSFDQAPAATIIEQNVISWLCRRCGLPASASGSFTAGGTQSNYMGLLLARDYFLDQRWQWDTFRHGLPPQSRSLRILCSEVAHFSIEKAAIQLGLGTDAVIKVPMDSGFRMQPDELVRCIGQLREDGLEPMVIVATAGTTDFGSFDPLPAIAAIAKEHALWLHVDAAYGGALMMSEQHCRLLAGIEQADSVTIDFHKAFFQPISCGAFLLADAERFRFIQLHAAIPGRDINH